METNLSGESEYMPEEWALHPLRLVFSLPKLVDAIKFVLDPKVKEHVVELAKDMENEDGVTGAIKAFLKHLPCSKPNPEPEPEPSSLFSKPRMHLLC
ncbi:sterol 3-beta-glucosyltransferase UGT80A2 [Prunus yedoensis var. nudiflora]|uniref:Sterol 3-beta-glucosyltransferase UGT80A2 n=1 Tax=Prunus yedoensis var. nudiflora TaxID=2094558 RepID=A0A314UCX3_PRUYE|nr:sterol 3-beta-glucosyltransferase UGT80A2 [Prunus yedoensis var. nudiflora]